MALPHNDGAVQTGTDILSIDGVSWFAQNISLSRPTKKIRRMDNNGEPDGQKVYADFTEFTCDIQLPDGDTTPPAQGVTFTHQFRDQSAAETYLVADYGETQGQEDQVTIPLTCLKVYN